MTYVKLDYTQKKLWCLSYLSKLLKEKNYLKKKFMADSEFGSNNWRFKTP